MRLPAIFTVAILVVTPGLAMAECSWGHKMEQTVASCAEGKVWDASTQACVDQLSG
ncbi:hypothetical protein [Dinoroseobacter sp. S76]|uniref:hypothetical protein n=1 Tax=Dinoroseobacter sp. S76 TaxID=3415124 RepID=UPI003C7B6B32